MASRRRGAAATNAPGLRSGRPVSAEPDNLFGGRLRLYQPARGAHRAGTDAVLLARLIDPVAGATSAISAPAAAQSALPTGLPVPG